MPAKCGFESITIRQLFGIDESAAALTAEMSGADVRDELINLSITKIDGVAVLPGVSGFMGPVDSKTAIAVGSGYLSWSSKIRRVVSAYFDRVNSTELKLLFHHIDMAERNGTEVVDGKTHMTFGLPSDCEFTHVTMREMQRNDEVAAAAAKDETAQGNEMLRRCIVKTNEHQDGLDVGEWDSLRLRTQVILQKYWEGMNIVPDVEITPLADAAMEEEEPVAEQADSANSAEHSSPSGSGSAQQADVA